MSASANTTCGPLPPSSSITCLPAARLATEAPVSVDPTKPTPSTSGCPATSSPTSAPGPVTRFAAPAGKSADLLAPLLDRLGDPMQALRALESLESGHAGAGAVRGLDRALRVGARALRHLGDDLARGGAVGVEMLATHRTHPRAIDEHLL